MGNKTKTKRNERYEHLKRDLVDPLREMYVIVNEFHKETPLLNMLRGKTHAFIKHRETFL